MKVATGQETPFINFEYFEVVDFSVEITECITELRLNGAAIPTLNAIWTKEFNLFKAETVLSSMTQVPFCGYKIRYEAYAVGLGGEQISLDNIPEANFYPES